MKRLVDLDLLTEQILAYARNGKNPEWVNMNDVLCVLDDGQLIIEEQPKVGEWISVEDRLPEKEKYVLLISKGWKNSQNDVYIGCLKDNAIEADPKGERNFWGIPTEETDWSIYGWSYFKKPNVTHWQPLPEPPKE
ncbi:MAG: DUF551 domain-containing protein [Bacillota bacterium]|jgi:hypothetical protein